jgi:hypothetical protein
MAEENVWQHRPAAARRGASKVPSDQEEITTEAVLRITYT